MTSLAQHLRIIAGKIETGEDCREDVVTLLRAADLMARFMAVADEVRTIEQLSKHTEDNDTLLIW